MPLRAGGFKSPAYAIPPHAQNLTDRCATGIQCVLLSRFTLYPCGNLFDCSLTLFYKQPSLFRKRWHHDEVGVFIVVSHKLGAEGGNRTLKVSQWVLSPPRLPVSPQPQSWCVSPDSNRDPIKEAGLSRSRLPIPARGAILESLHGL